jgi:predicted MFS family arabinose efflux permease
MGSTGSRQVSSPAYGWILVAALAVTTTLGYGVLSYAFAVFLVPMQHDLGTGRTPITFAATLTLLAAALASVPAGRWLDRHGGRGLMVGGSIVATVGLLAWSQVHSLLALYAVAVLIGFGTVGVLYEAAFAVVVTWFEQPRRGTAMLTITIAGGFASTIFLPLTGVLVDAYGWRHALIVLAIIYGALTIPLHALVRRPPTWPGVRHEGRPGAGHGTGSGAGAGDRKTVLAKALRDPVYWLMTGSFVAESIGIFVLSVHIVAYLVELGHSATLAATIAGLFGVLSVTGRIVTTFAQRRTRMTTIVAVIFLVQAAGAVALPFLGGSIVGAVACILAFGIGFGVGTIARPAMIADRYGVTGYATLAGLMAGLLMVTKAAVPLGAAYLRTLTGSYTLVMIICAVGAVLGALGLLTIGTTRTADGHGHGSGQEAQQNQQGRATQG